MLIIVRIAGIICQLILTVFIYKVEGSQSLVLYGFLAGVLNFTQLSDLGISYICRQKGGYLSRTVLWLLLGWILIISILTTAVIVCLVEYAEAFVPDLLLFTVVVTGGVMFIQSIYFNRYKDVWIYCINPIGALVSVFVGLTTGMSAIPVYFATIFLCWLALMLNEMFRDSLPGDAMDLRALWSEMKTYSIPSSANRLSSMSTTSLVQMLLPLSGDPAFVASYLLLVRPAQAFRTLYIAIVQRYWTNMNVGTSGFPIKISARLTIDSARMLNVASCGLLVLCLGFWWVICNEFLGLESEAHHWIILVVLCVYIALILTEIRITRALIKGYVSLQAQAGVLSLIVSMVLFKLLSGHNVQGWFVLLIPLINRGLKVCVTLFNNK